MTPPATPRPPRKTARTTRTAEPPAPEPKPVRYASEGSRKRPPKAEIDGKISGVVSDARRLNGLTQQDLATAAGMTVHMYVRLEHGKVAWLVSQLIGVAKALRVQPTDLLVAAQLSDVAGSKPEDVIGRDSRLSPFARNLALESYRQLLAQHDPSGGD